ncbi:MAG: hypothetical protein QXI27_06710 [Nitrososphaerota archaeon]
MERGRVDMYFVAGVIGISPSYAYQLLKVFMSNPYVHKELAKRGVSTFWDGKEIRAIMKQNAKTLEDMMTQKK